VKTVAVVQSNYIPWKGYFDLIARADVFVLLDDVQFTKRDWRNRNRIKTPQGLRWLTIPVETKGRYEQRIHDVRIGDPGWARSHWDAIRQSYRRAPHFVAESAWLEPLYLERASRLTHLSEVNRLFLAAICERLGIGTELRDSAEFALAEGKTDRLLGICRDLGAGAYLSGPAARDYLDTESFIRAGIEVRWMEYSGYPTYDQPHGAFEHGVSVVDTLLCTGAAATAACLHP
jgi:hypothetical protein